MTLTTGVACSDVMDAARNSWLFRPAPCASARARLFCFPHAGVGASVFRLWPAGLPTDLDMCAVQLPGRTIRLSEPAIPSIPALADAIITAITPHLVMPFALFGHSMGAALAAEVAHGLAARGLPQPRRLIVSGRRPPRVPDPLPPLSGLSDPDFVAEIKRRYDGIPHEILANPDILAMLLPALRADIVALETYRPSARRPLNCPISVFGGAEDALAPRAHLDAWRDETASTFDVRVFPGGHFYLETERAAVLAQLSAMLALLLTANREPVA